MSIRIVTDSACDLPQPLVDELDIVVVPLTIRFGDEEFVDREDLTPGEFWARCAASPVLPETAAPSPGQFEAAYRRQADAGATGIVVIALSGALSATIQSAELAARSSPVPVRIVDSRSVTMGEGMMAAACARAARDGASIDDIEALGNDLAARTRVFGALDTLDNLKKGGRIGGAKALLASALAIKPLIEVRNGRVEEMGRQRTRGKALAALVDRVREAGPIENLAVMHADCSDIDAFVAQLTGLYDGEIIVGDIGAVIGTHAGRGTIGLGFHVPRSS
jgi:DegV family protein with EDD domain